MLKLIVLEFIMFSMHTFWLFGVEAHFDGSFFFQSCTSHNKMSLVYFVYFCIMSRLLTWQGLMCIPHLHNVHVF